MRALILFFLFFMSNALYLCAQTEEYKLQDYHPVSPSAFQFLKYDAMPVSEYTGIPDISIPLYTIDVDDIKIPVNLTYHAGGIRVSQEASWVGLGWDLNVGGCIIQQINNIDDYSASKRLQPDYHNTGFLAWYPIRYASWVNGGFVYSNNNGAGWSNPYPLYTGTTYDYSYMIATGYYMPINGNFDDQSDGQYISLEGSECTYDSDPDIFKATFLGHSITFTMNFQTGAIVVLNKPGYIVTRTGNTYEIVVPSGEQYFFEKNTTDSSYTSSSGGLSMGINSSGGIPTSKVWVLTKIITKNQKQILLNYTQAAFVDNYPNYSEKWDSLVLSGIPSTITTCNYSGSVNGYIGMNCTWGGNHNICGTFSYSKENKLFLSSIVFPEGEVDFNISPRNDMLGGQKLDSVQIKSPQATIRTFQFNYNYFDASGVGGNVYTPSNASEFGNMPNLRLKLLSLQDNSGAIYQFTYNTNPLPAKNSLTQDYWGFYNGQLTNQSLIPNPARMNNPQLGDNGNNNSASSFFAQSGMLTKIQYPTGGFDSLEYELNQFSNYWVPDLNSNTNQISSGKGLRIHAIDYHSTSSSLAKKTVYSYDGGIDIIPLSLSRIYTLTLFNFSNNMQSMDMSQYTVNELCAKGFFGSNFLSSIDGIGYSKVTKQDIDINGNSIGRIESYFFNTPDNESTCGVQASSVAAVLPVTKNINNPVNGSEYLTLVYDNQNKLVKKISNTYYNTNYFISFLNSGTANAGSVNTYTYGAKIFGYGNLLTKTAWTNPGSGGSGCGYIYVPLPQTLIGYYPIYDFETLQTQKITTEYSGTDSLVTTETYNYDLYNRPTSTTKNSVSYVEQNNFYYTNNLIPTTSSTPYNISVLNNSNRLLDVVAFSQYKGNYPSYSYIKNYMLNQNNAVVEDTVSITHNPMNIANDTVTYDLYDAATANLLQYTAKKTITSYLWGYNGLYPVAKIVGSNYATASSLVTQSQIDNAASTSDISLRNVLKTLRTNLPNALVYTYTYAPLIGMTSETDPTGKTTYYEYDGSNRLRLIRDNDNNIIKKLYYNYYGQTENFSDNIYYNDAISGIYTKNNCGTGYVGSSVTYTVPANTYSSTFSKADANSKAKNDTLMNGQNYANANGSCTSTSITFTCSDTYTGTGYYYGFRIVFKDQTTGTTYTIPCSPGSSQSSIPVGTYTVTLQQNGGMTGTSYGYSIVSNYSSSSGRGSGSTTYTITNFKVQNYLGIYLSN